MHMKMQGNAMFWTAKTILGGGETKLEDSHFPISNLLQSNNNQYHVILAQGQA